MSTSTTLTAYTFEDIEIGQTAEYRKRIEAQDIALFAAASGDVNPVHMDAEFAATTAFGERIAHGMLSGALISAALAMELPGPGTVYLSQSLRFRRPVKIGDDVTVKLEVVSKQDRKSVVTLDCTVVNQDGKVVVSGTAEVIPSSTPLTVERAPLPRFSALSGTAE